jgi:hypothetical protein
VSHSDKKFLIERRFSLEKEKDRKLLEELGAFADMIQHTSTKIVFLREFFTHNVPDDELFCERARTGLLFIMDDIEETLEFIVDGLYKIYKMRLGNLVKEKPEES